MLKTIRKKISEIFEPVNGNSKYTKKYCSEHIGNYIVYTGTTIGIFAKVDAPDYTEPNLTFTTDGENAGTIEYIVDEGYCIGGHRTILKPIINNISLEYFKHILQPVFYKNVKDGSVPSLRFNQVADVEVEVPALDEDTLDIDKQIELAKKYNDVEIKRCKLLNDINFLKEVKISIGNENDSTFKNVPLNDMFKLKRGKIISKVDIMNNKGKYPVYSTQREIYGYISTYMQDGKFLLWNTDGLGGYIKIANGKFSYTNIVGILLPKKENYNFDKVSLGYLKCILEPIFRANRKGRMGINGKNEYTKINSTMIEDLNIQIPMPIKDNDFDFEKQEEIMRKYESINNIKKTLSESINRLLEIKVI